MFARRGRIPFHFGRRSLITGVPLLSLRDIHLPELISRPQHVLVIHVHTIAERLNYLFHHKTFISCSGKSISIQGVDVAFNYFLICWVSKHRASQQCTVPFHLVMDPTMYREEPVYQHLFLPRCPSSRLAQWSSFQKHRAKVDGAKQMRSQSTHWQMHNTPCTAMMAPNNWCGARTVSKRLEQRSTSLLCFRLLSFGTIWASWRR